MLPDRCWKFVNENQTHPPLKPNPWYLIPDPWHLIPNPWYLNMFYRHWKKFALALTAFFWSGCSDNTSSSEEPIACSLIRDCPVYGVIYDCENEEDYQSPDIDSQCTTKHDYSCSKRYSCDDGSYCYETTKNNADVIYCPDEPDNSAIYTEKEFFSKYYIKDWICNFSLLTFHF